MKIINKICFILFLAHVSYAALGSEEPTRWWHKLSYACSKASSSVSDSFQKLKNLQWTTSNVTKTAFVATFSAAAIYGISRGLRYYLCKKAQNATEKQDLAPQPPVQQDDQSQIKIDAQLQEPSFSTPAPSDTIKQAPAQSIEPAGTMTDSENTQQEHKDTDQQTSPEPTEHVQPSSQQQEITVHKPEIKQSEPLACAADAAVVVISEEPSQHIQQITAAAAASDDEQLPVVPYFDTQENHVLEPIRCRNEKDEQVTVQQLLVFDQHAQDSEGHDIGGGHNSCGYHAGPKNIPAIIGLIQKLDQQHDFAQLLRNSKPVQELFSREECQPGVLRNIIIINRIKTALKQFYSPRIQIVPPTVAPESPEKREHEIFIPYYNRLKTIFLDNTIAEILDTDKDRVITLTSIIQNFMQQPIDIAQATLEELHCSQEEFLARLHNQEKIEQYVHLPEAFTLSSHDSETAISTYNIRQRAGKADLNGDMLNQTEIEELIKFQQSTPGRLSQSLNPQHVTVTVLEQATPDLFAITDNLLDLRKHIEEGTLPMQHIQAFVLGNTDQRAQNAGHWITMILEFARKHRRYTIANSAYNCVSTFSGPAHDLIQYLEGDTIAAQVKPSESFKQGIVGKLQSCIEQCKTSFGAPQPKEQLQCWLMQFDEFVQDYSSFGGQEKFHSIIREVLTD
jgi:hypothetical protein